MNGQLLSQKYYNVYGIFQPCYKENMLVQVEVESIIKTVSMTVEISQALAGETGKSMKYSYPVFFGCLDLQWVVALGK